MTESRSDVADDGDEALRASRRSRRRRLVVVLAAVAVVLVAGGVVTGVLWTRHYSRAAALTTDGGGWLPPDNAHVRFVHAGPYSASVIRPRPGHRQTFELEIYNPSAVSQTVLGLTDGRTLADPKLTGEPETLAISTFAAAGDSFARFTSRPVTIPPRGQYELRFTIRTARGGLWRCGRSEYWQSLSLRVRVGVFTRTENLDLGDLIMEISVGGRC